MFHAGCHIIFADMIRITSLKTSNRSLTHFCVYVTVFTVVLPHTRPAWITSQVDYWSIGPGDTAGFSFVCRNGCCLFCQFTVESCSHIDALREHGSIKCIGSSVNLVDTIDTRYADFFHGQILNLFDCFSPFFLFLCDTQRNIQQ